LCQNLAPVHKIYLTPSYYYLGGRHKLNNTSPAFKGGSRSEKERK
jgi:hypothetical protein